MTLLEYLSVHIIFRDQWHASSVWYHNFKQWQRFSVEMNICGGGETVVAARFLSNCSCRFTVQQLSGILSIAGCQWCTTKSDSKCCLRLQLHYSRKTAGSNCMKAWRKMVTASNAFVVSKLTPCDLWLTEPGFWLLSCNLEETCIITK